MKTYPMVSFRCDTKLILDMEREAKRRGISLSELIKQAITTHLTQPKDTQ
jgi:hypothetical protein